MFIMTCNIKIEGIKAFGNANSIEWEKGLDNYRDSATVKLPLSTQMKSANSEVVEKLKIKIGTAITIEAGYDKKNPLRFKGFITRINYSTPLELECEGYSYLLKTKHITKSYGLTTLKTVLKDIVNDTPIKLSKLIPDVELENVVFVNKTGCEALELLKEKFACSLYFDNDVLYAGLAYTFFKPDVKHRIGWNIANDKELVFAPGTEPANLKIRVEKRSKNGPRTVVESDGNGEVVKTVKCDWVISEADMKIIANEARNRFASGGYSGSLLGFLIPAVEPGMATEISNTRYPERTGKYLVTNVKGRFDVNGGRQIITLGVRL